MKQKSDEGAESLPEQDNNKRAQISDWNKKFSGQEPVMWDRIPDIELYMDQVVTFLDRQLQLYRRNEEDRSITPSMINNYTKDHVIPRAESKKYSRDHIALLMVVCSLKKVLSMPDLSDLLKDLKANESDKIEKFYELFRNVQKAAVEKTSGIIAEEIKKIGSGNENEILRNLALRLAVEAQTKCTAAEQILEIIGKNEAAAK